MSAPAPKHLPFDSIYRPDFEVVEQREGKLSYFPHTEQLPRLLRALNLEFYGALPDRVAGANARTDGFRKIMLKTAVLIFCAGFNGARSDQLRLFKLWNPDLVAKVSIVQQITETTRRGLCHHFRFYAGEDFFPEIFLSGKRVIFPDHVLQRFSARVPNHIGTDLTMFLLCFFGSPVIAQPVGPGRAFLLPYQDTILAFPYKESETEYFITTCLTVNEINSMGCDIPPQAFNLHYGAAFTKPKVRNWMPLDMALTHRKCWEKKSPLPAPVQGLEKKQWYRAASYVKDMVVKAGHGPGSKLSFLDNIPGPLVLESRPGQTEMQYDELAALKQTHPQYDWETIIAERDAAARKHTPRIED